jgi:hypothetical protein
MKLQYDFDSSSMNANNLIIDEVHNLSPNIKKITPFFSPFYRANLKVSRVDGSILYVDEDYFLVINDNVQVKYPTYSDIVLLNPSNCDILLSYRTMGGDFTVNGMVTPLVIQTINLLSR